MNDIARERARTPRRALSKFKSSFFFFRPVAKLSCPSEANATLYDLGSRDVRFTLRNCAFHVFFSCNPTSAKIKYQITCNRRLLFCALTSTVCRPSVSTAAAAAVRPPYRHPPRHTHAHTAHQHSHAAMNPSQLEKPATATIAAAAAAASSESADEQELAKFGYRQEFKREFTNLSVRRCSLSLCLLPIVAVAVFAPPN